MDVITNKEVNVYLDNEKGTLCLTGMLVGTMVFLYDSQGELKEKHRFAIAFTHFGDIQKRYLCLSHEPS